MRSKLFSYMALACLCGCAVVAAADARVTIELAGTDRHVRTPDYEAVVAADGRLTSLRFGGDEFVQCDASGGRGAYLYQNGILPLTRIETIGAETIVASSEKATERFDFTPIGFTWTATNLTAEKMLHVLVFDPAVTTMSYGSGTWEQTPITTGCVDTNWFRGASRLTIRNGTRVWGPFAQKYQVWEASLAPNETRKVVFEPGVATVEEMAQAAAIAAYVAEPPTDPVGPMWNMAELGRAPATYPADGFEEKNGVRPLFYDGVPYKGRPTRVFAWIGLPKLEPGQKVPGMVLVHGGGGTAFANWVKLWTDRGYAAIAMDTCGCVPRGKYGNWERHQWSGPAGWGGWGQINWARQDQWTYHAVAAAALGHSLLRALPEVAPDSIGLTGISWGGYLTCIIAGVDHRYKFAVPVYGCGFTNEHNFAGSVKGLGEEGAARWMRWWDPSVYLTAVTCPMLWVTGTNDFAYTFPALQKSYRLPPAPRTLCIRVRMPHGHGPAGEAPKEIGMFADGVLRGGVPLARVTGQGRDGARVWATYESEQPIVRAELTFTKASGPWKDRLWETLPGELDRAATRAMATLPADTTVYYINLFDDRDLAVSSEHEELPAAPGQ